jgi:hypothetical protein
MVAGSSCMEGRRMAAGSRMAAGIRMAAGCSVMTGSRQWTAVWWQAQAVCSRSTGSW